MRVPKKQILTAVIAFCLLAFAGAANAQNRRPPELTNYDQGRYRIQPGDVLEVQYRYSPEFNQTVTVQPDGYVSLEIGGELKVSELTVEQARRLILQKAEERLRSPEATIILKDFQKPFFVVAGEVAQPGKVEMHGRVTALQAIMLAGGFKESAKSSQVIIFRAINTDIAEVKSLDLKSVKRTSDLENDLTLQPGDMVFVPRDKLTKIERFMKIASIAAFITPRL